MQLVSVVQERMCKTNTYNHPIIIIIAFLFLDTNSLPQKSQCDNEVRYIDDHYFNPYCLIDCVRRYSLLSIIIDNLLPLLILLIE